ncbi:MAG: RagB/SusD family nutrient uptake outer membrane protein [Ginsengibacter sp.]
MKKILLKIILISSVILYSCNKWVTVEPENEVTKEVLFNSPSGFENALNGIYLNLADQALYGGSLSYGLVSILSQNYKITVGSDIYTAAYDYDNMYVKPKIAQVWERMYNVIANCNSLIKAIPQKDTSFFPEGQVQKDVLLGEALAVRGMAHFDILRLFAPSPVVDKNIKLVPYYKNYPSQVEPRLSATEILSLAAEDLEQAKKLVAYADTVLNTSAAFASPISRLTGGYAPNGGSFYNKRGTRMNYFAICGILARLYLYAGDKENALKNAREVGRYSDKSDLTRYYFYFTPESALLSSVSERDRKLTQDIILGFYDKYALNEYESFLGTQQSVYVQNANTMFVPDLDDFRRTKLLEQRGAQWVSLKYMRALGSGTVDRTMGPIIPALRLSEIYYIIAECTFDTDPEEAVSYLNAVRKGRGITANPIQTPISKTDFMKALVKDARKEFIGEAQLFYMLKRLNLPVTMDNEVSKTLTKEFVLPIPESETSY